MKYALLSVFDKTGIVDFAKNIADLGYKIISTGGTAKHLQENGVQIIPIQEITGNPESFDGRMKTISFQIESGIIFDRSNPSHVEQAKQLDIKPIDIVVNNLYPFEKEQTVENIDVGGPTMIRAAAKNFKSVIVIVDPGDYKKVSNVLRHPDSSPVILASEERTRPEFDSGVALLPRMTIEFRQELAAKAFAHLSLYDSQIATFLGKEQFPKEITIPGRKVMDLRYGENPYQNAALYLQPNAKSPFEHLEKLWGRDLSLINLTDINAGIASVSLFDPKKDGYAAVVIKHNNPCGIALGSTPKDALTRAIEADAESAFGGIIVLNGELDEKTAHVVAQFKDEKQGNIDIIAAPKIHKDALSLLSTIRKSMGVYTFGHSGSSPVILGSSATPESDSGQARMTKAPQNDGLDIKFVQGGFILQTTDDVLGGFDKWEVVTKAKPTEEQMEQIKLAWKFISRIKSNAVIVVDKGKPMTRGIGTGQTSRVRATKIALDQAGERAIGAILASDSFFPFGDSVELAAKFGITAIVQQGDSINDKASIDAADKARIAMVFTHRRAFWH